MRSCWARRNRSACRSRASSIKSWALNIAAQPRLRLLLAVASERDSSAALARLFAGCGYRYLRLGAEVGEHREDAAVVLLALRNPQLGEDASHVLLDRTLGDHEPLRDRAVRTSFGHQRQHLPLAVAQVVDRVVPLPAAADQLCDDRGVEHRSALAD